MKIIFRNYRSFFGQTENIFGLTIISVASNTKKYKKYFLMKFGKKLLVSGLINKSRVCDSCQLWKSKQLPFSDSPRISTFPLELIHSDV
jgi:hypothetical protein